MSPLGPVALLAFAVLAGCTAPAPTQQAPALDPLEPLAHLQTSLGNITIGLYEQMVPLTANNFETLVQSHAYDGTRFTRIVKGYDIQGGDLASAGRPAATYGIPDEFHPALRHDRAGLVSMATRGPDTGNTQFFITTAPAPGFDDRYSVFGHVVSGMDTVDAIAALPLEGPANATFGAPAAPVTLLHADLERPAVPNGTLRHGVAVRTLSGDKTASPGGPSTFALVVTNMGNSRDSFTLTAQAPAGWNLTFDNPRVALPAGRSWVVLLTATPQPRTQGVAAVQIQAHSENDAAAAAQIQAVARVQEPGPRVQVGDTVSVEYTGLLEDGRIFDTDVKALGEGGATKMSSVFHRDAYGPYNFTAGQDGVVGFNALVLGTKVGETRVARVPARLAYTDLPSGLLYGRNVLFEVKVLSTVSPTPTSVCDGLPKSTLALENANDTVVSIRTSAGCMGAELYDGKAPVTTANFLAYVRDGFYPGTEFYRIVAGFVSQAGGNAKTGTHPPIHDEARDSGLHNGKYTLAMARLGPACDGCPDRPDSATSEFYLNAADNAFLDPGGNSEAGYAVFGNLVAGRDVADRINGMSGATPTPTIESIQILS